MVSYLQSKVQKTTMSRHVLCTHRSSPKSPNGPPMFAPGCDQAQTQKPRRGPSESKSMSFLPWVAAGTAVCPAPPLAPGARARAQGGLALCAKHQGARKNVKSNKGSAAAAVGKHATTGDHRGALATAPCSLGPRPSPPPRRVCPYMVK